MFFVVDAIADAVVAVILNVFPLHLFDMPLDAIGVSDLLLIVLLLIPILLIYLVVRLQSMVSISSIAGFLQTKKNVYFTA